MSSPKNKNFAYKSLGDVFSLPSPVKFLFDKVPLVTYEANTPPARAPKPSRKPRLYVFSTPEDAAAGRPSFNPTCLKWQTYLKIAQISFDLVPSNNHASPTGALPFLLPAYSESELQEKNMPVPASKLRKYVKDNGKVIEETNSPRYEPYQSLLDNPIRKAWLHALYLSPENCHIPLNLYVNPACSNFFVRKSTAHNLTSAARSEIVSSSATSGSSLSIFNGYSGEIRVEFIYKEAADAFEALSMLLGDDEWFFGLGEPGEFDAAVFAYTQLLLDEKLGWRDVRLRRLVEEWKNLVGHRERILERCYEVVYE